MCSKATVIFKKANLTLESLTLRWSQYHMSWVWKQDERLLRRLQGPRVKNTQCSTGQGGNKSPFQRKFYNLRKQWDRREGGAEINVRVWGFLRYNIANDYTNMMSFTRAEEKNIPVSKDERSTCTWMCAEEQIHWKMMHNWGKGRMKPFHDCRETGGHQYLYHRPEEKRQGCRRKLIEFI